MKKTLVYSMGKTSSRSIYETLKEKTNVYHLHYLNPQEVIRFVIKYTDEKKVLPPHLLNSLKFLNHNMQNYMIVGCLRKSVERNLSAFFTNIIDFNIFEMPKEKFLSLSSDIKKKMILENDPVIIENFFIKNFPHMIPSNYIKKEYEKILSIKFEEIKDQFKKRKYYKKDNHLIFSFYLDDDEKKEIIKDFLQFDVKFKLVNSSVEKWSGKLYNLIKKRIIKNQTLIKHNEYFDSIF